MSDNAASVNDESGKPADHGTPTGGDERRAEIEAGVRSMWTIMQTQFEAGRTPESREPTRDDARRMLAGLDCVRDARDDESRVALNQTRCSGCTEIVGDEEPLRFRSGVLWHEACLVARSPQDEDHETSDAVRERPVRHLPVNGPDDRQPNAPDGGQLRDAATPASGRGRSSEQGENHEVRAERDTYRKALNQIADVARTLVHAQAIAVDVLSAPSPECDTERLTAELQALVDWFNDAPFPRAERLLHDLDEERGRDAR